MSVTDVIIIVLLLIIIDGVYNEALLNVILFPFKSNRMKNILDYIPRIRVERRNKK